MMTSESLVKNLVLPGRYSNTASSMSKYQVGRKMSLCSTSRTTRYLFPSGRCKYMMSPFLISERPTMCAQIIPAFFGQGVVDISPADGMCMSAATPAALRRSAIKKARCRELPVLASRLVKKWTFIRIDQHDTLFEAQTRFEQDLGEMEIR